MNRFVTLAFLILTSCGTLQNGALKVNSGDTKEQVTAAWGNLRIGSFRVKMRRGSFARRALASAIMTTGWCVLSRKGYGHHILQDHTPASGCAGHFRPIQWI